MKNKKKNSLMLLALTTFAVSATALIGVTATSASADTANAGVKTVDEINATLTDKDYYFKGYSLKWDDETAYGDTTSGDTALRFKMYITDAMHSYLTSTEGAKTGTLIYAAENLENGAVENLTKTSANGTVKPMDVETTEGWSKLATAATIDGTSYTYENTVYLREIPDEFYSSALAVRGYVTVGNDTYYTDATNETARSLSYIANEEYTDADSALSADKAEFKEALLKFTFKIDDGTASYKYYGETADVTAPEEIGYFTRYTNQDETLVWSATETILGNTWLKTQRIDAQRYYSSVKKAATFEVADIAAGVTQATVNGQSVTVTTEEGKVTLPEITGLTVGKSYLATVGDVTFAFTYVTDVKDYVPYASAGQLWFDELGAYSDTATTITAITDLVGADKLTADSVAVVTDVAENRKKEVAEGPSLLVSATVESEEVLYKVDTKVYNRVLYTNEQGTAFFFGATESVYSTFMIDGVASGFGFTVALANNLSIGNAPNDYTGNKGFTGVLDGLGHSIDWNSTEANENAVWGGSLFGYYMGGTVKNVALNVHFTNTYADASTGYNKHIPIISSYFYANAVENTVITIDAPNPNGRFILGNGTKNQHKSLKNVTVIYKVGKTGFPASKCTLFRYHNFVDAAGDPVTFYADTVSAVDGQENQWVYDYEGISNVQVIIPANVEATLGTVDGRSNEYCIGENQSYTATNTVKMAGINVYNYGDAGIATKVGDWTLNLGTAVTEITASYGG